LKELTFAKYHRSKFLYKDLILQEGDEILVLQNLPNDGLGGGSSSNGNGNEYAAIICGLTSTEIFVLSEKGKYQRLLVNDLRTNKVLFVLAPDNNNNNNNNNSSSNKRR
jgi:hypothetical protein